MKKLIKYFILLIIFFPLQCYALEGESSVTLSNCVDANSARFMLEQSEIKVKFIGIDSSDIIYDDYNDEINGKLVNDYVCSVLTNAKEIKIEYEPNSEKEDKYGRILAWVYVDGVLLQRNLVELGYSRVAYLYDNYKYSEELKLVEKSAKENKFGIWYGDNTLENNFNDFSEEIEILIDDNEEEGFFAKILSYLNDIFEKLLSYIDKLISEIL